jgi:hypothetical protein
VTPQDRALLMVYESVKHRLTVGLVEYIEAVKDWEVIPLTESGRVIGGVLVKDNEIHVGYGVKPIGCIRAYIRAILGGVIDKYGFAITTVQAENLVGLRFCERLGFVKLSANDGKILLRCDRSNYL